MLLERHSDHDEGSWMMKNQKKLGKKWIEKGLAGLSSQKKMLLCPWIGAVQCKGCNYDLNSTKINENARDHWKRKGEIQE